MDALGHHGNRLGYHLRLGGVRCLRLRTEGATNRRRDTYQGEVAGEEGGIQRETGYEPQPELPLAGLPLAHGTELRVPLVNKLVNGLL